MASQPRARGWRGVCFRDAIEVVDHEHQPTGTARSCVPAAPRPTRRATRTLQSRVQLAVDEPQCDGPCVHGRVVVELVTSSLRNSPGRRGRLPLCIPTKTSRAGGA